MGMPISITAAALIDQLIITTTEAKQFENEAAALNIDLIDYLYHHSSYDSESIARACANYFGITYLETAELENARLIGHSIHFQDKGSAAIAIYRPADIKRAYKAAKTYFISAKYYLNLYQKLARQSGKLSIEQTTIAELNALINYAIDHRCSDIHIEPQQHQQQIRLRIDGELQVYQSRSTDEIQPIITRLKVLSKVDITQNRLPQDGQMTYHREQRDYDCRLSFCPSLWGEKVVIRLLESNQHTLQLNELGLEPQQKQLLLRTLQCKQGFILVTGPTGSGKTQTLYTILSYLNRIESNIISIEDPVEIKLNGITQIQVDDKIGLSFATILRSLLRQDPDIIMIGEIRDHETAELAIHAAHTGHLVLATLHTQNAFESIARLENLGISHYNITSTIKLVIAQRLIKKQTQGRTGVFELADIAKATHQPPTNFMSLWDAGMAKVNRNEISLSELKRIIPQPQTAVTYD